MRAVKFLFREFFRSRCGLLRARFSAEEAAVFRDPESSFAGEAVGVTPDYVVLMMRHSANSGKRVCLERARWLVVRNKQAYTDLFYGFYFSRISKQLNVPLEDFQILKKWPGPACITRRSSSPRVKTRKVRVNSKILKLLFSSERFCSDVVNYLNNYFVLECQSKLNRRSKSRRLPFVPAQLVESR